MRTSVDRSNPIPRYLQVRSILEKAICAGRYGPGDRLPGERDLAVQLRVSQMTVNKAIQALVTDGWLRREVGVGTFVKEDLQPRSAAINVGFAVPFGPAEIAGDFYLGSLLRGVQSALGDVQASLSLLETPTDSLDAQLEAAPMDGYLLLDVMASNLRDVEHAAAHGRRIVMLAADNPPAGVCSIEADNYGGARTAVEHLVGLGHRRIAGVFAYSGSCDTRQRLRAFGDVLEENGIGLPRERLMAFGAVYPLLDRVRSAALALLQRDDRPTAFFCGGCTLALEVMHLAREIGLRVPEDVSVVGFDDPITARYVSPGLTTVQQPLEDLGREAMLLLLDWIRLGRQPAPPRPLPTAFVIRGSTAPPASR